jgi:hypothetical protein
MELRSQRVSPSLQVDTKPNIQRPPKRGRSRLSLLLMFSLGLLVGMCLMAALGFGLYWYGYLTPGSGVVLPTVCPATPAFFPQCPTCPAPPTATADFGATATAACSTFQYAFPGTPCP